MLLYLATLLIASAAYAQKPPLADYAWKNRLLLLFGPSADTPAQRAKLVELGQEKEALAERHMQVVVVTPQGCYTMAGAPIGKLDAMAVYQHYGVRPGFEGVLLVGKDQGEKLRDAPSVALAKIFALIDTMPMRRQEMRKAQ